MPRRSSFIWRAGGIRTDTHDALIPAAYDLNGVTDPFVQEIWREKKALENGR